MVEAVTVMIKWPLSSEIITKPCLVILSSVPFIWCTFELMTHSFYCLVSSSSFFIILESQPLTVNGRHISYRV